ncbi:MAG: hypothetical protein ACOCVF_02870 [bacterium]
MQKITLARRIAIYNAKVNKYIDSTIIETCVFDKKDLLIEYEQLSILLQKDYNGFDKDRILSHIDNKHKINLNPKQIVEEIIQFEEEIKNEKKDM